MSKQTADASNLTQQIQQLIEARQRHVEALAGIDQTLDRIRAALGTKATTKGSTSAPASRAVPATSPTPSGGKGRGRSSSGSPNASGNKQHKRRTFAVSGEESILAFVKAKKNPTTQEISKLWESEGRGGTSDNLLSRLVKAKKLKREPLKDGRRGSRYLLT